MNKKREKDSLIKKGKTIRKTQKEKRQEYYIPRTKKTIFTLSAYKKMLVLIFSFKAVLQNE